MFSERNLRLAEEVLNRCRNRNLRLATAESCTGGLVAACLTAIPGSSNVFDRGFITYDNAAKVEMLGVSEKALVTYGAVSEIVARAMAEGALANAPVQIAVATSGIAGPCGGSETKPVGLVHIAIAMLGGGTMHAKTVFDGDRERVRITALEKSLSMLNEYLN